MKGDSAFYTIHKTSFQYVCLIQALFSSTINEPKLHAPFDILFKQG